MRSKALIAITVLVAGVVLNGCRIDTAKNGEDREVKVATPFGGVHVKTDEPATVSLGLPIYPGAQLVKKDNDHGAADVNLSFGKFHLRVKAATYRTGDSPDKVQSFYRDALRRYGTVIQCNNNQAVGTPSQTEEGLTCDNNKENHVSVNSDVSSKTELKAGSKQHQHIVAIDADGSGTKFGVIALDLPINVTADSSDTRQ